jgi:hypothetical protein
MPAQVESKNRFDLCRAPCYGWTVKLNLDLLPSSALLLSRAAVGF